MDLGASYFRALQGGRVGSMSETAMLTESVFKLHIGVRLNAQVHFRSRG